MPNIRGHWTKLFAPDYQQLVGVNYFQLKPVAVLQPHQFYDVAWDGQKDSLAILQQQQQQQLPLIVGCKIGNAGRMR
jgi:hypothetical protein